MEISKDMGEWNGALDSANPSLNWIHCTERLHGIFDLGEVVVQNSAINGDDGSPLPVTCLKSFLPLKVQAIAEGFGGEAPDMKRCEEGWAAGPKTYCVASRGFPNDGLPTLTNDLIQKIKEDFGVDVDKDLPVPEICNDDIGRADWVVSLWYQHQQKATPDAQMHELCNLGGQAVTTAYPSRKECIVDDYPSVPSWYGASGSASNQPKNDGASTVVDDASAESAVDEPGPSPSPSEDSDSSGTSADANAAESDGDEQGEEGGFFSTAAGKAVIVVVAVGVLGGGGYFAFTAMNAPAGGSGKNVEMKQRK